mgnify:FL=1
MGFKGVEIFENDFLVHDLKAKEIKKIVYDYGLEISLFQPFRDFEGMPEPYRSRAFDRAKKKFDIMNELGAKTILICSNTSNLAIGGIDRAADDFNELGEIAKVRDIFIGYEALAWGKYISDHRDAWEIVRRANHKHVGIILDSFHTLSKGINLDTITSIPKEKIFFVQIADAPKYNMDLLFWSRHFRNMPGQGDLKVSEFMKKLNDTGYDSWISLEIFNDQFRKDNRDLITKDGYRSLINLSKKNEIVEKAKIEKIEFIEFFVKKEDLNIIQKLLKSLGFIKTGLHKTKNITLYTLGNVKFIINSEIVSDQNLGEFNPYAFGLVVDNVKSTLKRCEALHINNVKDFYLKNKFKMNLIEDNGQYIFLIDNKNWQNDFNFLDQDNQNSNLEFDHIAISVEHSTLLSSVLFYKSLFECKKISNTDIIDPSGITKSHVIENKSKTFKIVINSAENNETLTSQLRKKKYISNIQHIALRTDDIFKLSKKFNELGLKTLKISDNYYDDIDAKFGLETNILKKIKENNILYDEDSDGSFFQIYTTLINNSFFLEFVQRNKSYDGYGANNAIFRISAQKKLIYGCHT